MILKRKLIIIGIIMLLFVSCNNSNQKDTYNGVLILGLNYNADYFKLDLNGPDNESFSLTVENSNVYKNNYMIEGEWEVNIECYTKDNKVAETRTQFIIEDSKITEIDINPELITMQGSIYVDKSWDDELRQDNIVYNWFPSIEDIPNKINFPSIDIFPNETSTGAKGELKIFPFPIYVDRGELFRSWVPTYDRLDLEENERDYHLILDNNIQFIKDENDNTIEIIIQDLFIKGGISILNDKVKIRVINCKISTEDGVRFGFGCPPYGTSEKNPSYYIVENCTFLNEIERYKVDNDIRTYYTEAAMHKAIFADSCTVRNCDISGYYDGVYFADNVIIENNYIHDLYYYDPNWEIEYWDIADPEYMIWPKKYNGKRDTTHSDGIQGGGENILIYGNYVNSIIGNACVMTSLEKGSCYNIFIKNNYFLGGNYSVYLRGDNYSSEYAFYNTKLIDNLFYHENPRRFLDNSYTENQDIEIKGNFEYSSIFNSILSQE